MRSPCGARFRGLLRNYYPWLPGEECDPKIDALYDIVRNPLAHALGILEPGMAPLSIDKGEDMTAEQVRALETAHDNGVQLPMAVEMVEGWWRVRVPFLYAGCLELLRRLARDRAQMQQTEQVFAAGA